MSSNEDMQAASRPPPASLAAKQEQGRKLARACRWACAAAPFPVVIALVCAFWPGEAAEILGAIAIALAFIGTLFGLAGLFGFVLAKELSSAVVRPKWCLWCAIFGIVGGFITSLLGNI